MAVPEVHQEGMEVVEEEDLLLEAIQDHLHEAEVLMEEEDHCRHLEFATCCIFFQCHFLNSIAATRTY